jgi:hypothetical protein
VLQVFSPACRQRSLELLGPLVVGPGKPKHLVRGQLEITEHRPKRLTRVDSVEELLPHLDGQACLRSCFLQARWVSLCARWQWVHLQPLCQPPDVPCAA